jgi:DNA-binding transcriptional LysR family regulator
MSPRDAGLSGLRFADLQTFVTVVRCRSISGAARQLQVTPSQVSKAVSRLEQQLGMRLLSRSARGASVTAAGQRIAPRVADVVAHTQRLQQAGGGYPEAQTVAAPAFLNDALFPQLVTRLSSLRLRSIELPPGLDTALSTQSLFDIALTVGAERWPESWALTNVGAIVRGLFCSRERSRELGRMPLAPARLRDLPFITPAYSYRGQLVPGDDGCPMPMTDRRIGCETQTLSVALEVACRSSYLVFAPMIAARPFLKTSQLIEVAVQGWDVRDPLYLACHADRVSAKVQQVVADELDTVLRSQ